MCRTNLSQVVGAYEEMQDIESLRLLLDLATTPADWSYHCGRFAASLVFTLSYGQRLNDDGKDLAAVQGILANFIRDTYPGAHFVDTFPILDRLPDFLSPYVYYTSGQTHDNHFCRWRAEAKRKHNKEVEVSLEYYLVVAREVWNSSALYSTGFWSKIENGERSGYGVFRCSVVGSTGENESHSRGTFLQYVFIEMLWLSWVDQSHSCWVGFRSGNGHHYRNNPLVFDGYGFIPRDHEKSAGRNRLNF
jgi:hypothetical protein